MPEDNYQHYEEANNLLRAIQVDITTTEPGMEADPWRRLLIDMAYHFGHSITEERPEKGKNIDLHIDPLIRTLRLLDRMPDHDRTVLVRAKETFFTGQRAVSTTDYIICFGDIVLDLQSVAAMAKRDGAGGTQLRTRMAIACERLARYQVQSLYIEIPRESPADTDRFRLSLRILSAFHQALQSKVPVYFFDGTFDRQIAIVTDRNDQPNPNLTVLAALNHLKPELIRPFIHRVEDWIRRPRTNAPGTRIDGLYGTLHAVRKILDQLRVPPFEINNTNRLTLDRIHDAICPEKTGVMRLVDEVTANSSPQDGARMIEAVYSADYDRIDALNLAGRLLLVSKLLETLEADGTRQETFREIRDNMNRRLRCVKDEVFGRLELVETGIKVTASPGDAGRGVSRPAVEGPLCTSLMECVRFLKDRSVTRGKIRRLANGPADFDERDQRVIAREFGITDGDAEQLLKLTGECFDASGRFQYVAFERRIDPFLAHERYIFDFFWNYLSEPVVREDRPGFLSAIQHLVARMNRPRAVAMKLISGFYEKPGMIRMSDRNALMLITLLARTHNRELRIDTEVTPEEVLMIAEGLNSEVTEAVRRRIDMEQTAFFAKIRTVDAMVVEMLSEQQAPSPHFAVTLPFMLALQRETLIALGMIGGETAYSVIRTVARELGDPSAAIHHLKKSPAVRPQLLSLLQTAIRALGRARRKEDAVLLRQIQDRAEAFEAFSRTDPRQAERVQRIMNWIEKILAELERD